MANVNSAMTLKQFLLRKEVLNLYRDFVRATKHLDRNDQKEMMDWIRYDFRRHMNEKDETSIKMLISMGRQSLKKLEASITLSKS